jgi:hypothetical protein
MPIFAKVLGMWRYGSLIVGAAALMTTGCAASDSAGPPDDLPTTVAGASIAVSAPAASTVRTSANPAPATFEASCTRDTRPMPAPNPSASFGPNDAEQRARRALAEQHRPSATRGAVPPAAVPGAEACLDVLRAQFSLLTAGSRTAPDQQAIEVALRSAGLTSIVVRSGPAFAASTGVACLYGNFTPTEPAFVIGPVSADGSCHI